MTCTFCQYEAAGTSDPVCRFTEMTDQMAPWLTLLTLHLVLLTLSGRGGGGGGSEAQMTKLTAANQKPYSLMPKICESEFLSLRHVLTKF